jgi:TPR repeat protein
MLPTTGPKIMNWMTALADDWGRHLIAAQQEIVCLVLPRPAGRPIRDENLNLAVMPFQAARSLRPTMRHYAKLLCATLTASLLLVAIIGAAVAGPLEDAGAAESRGDYATAIPIYRSLAEKGNVSAQVRLGFFYESGAGGLKRDWVESAQWFSKAADGGDESAVFVLSYLGRHWRYREGASAPPIIYELVAKEAKSGFAVAQFSLGVMYYPIGDPSFDATKGDLSRALVWYRRAAEQGNVDAEIALGLAHSQGIGVVQDYIETDKWFNIAASRARSADELLDIVTRHNKLAHMMTSSQVAEAQKLAREWKPKPER